MYPGILWKGFTTMSQLEDNVLLVDKTRVDSLLLISQSPLTLEDLNMKNEIRRPPYSKVMLEKNWML